MNDKDFIKIDDLFKGKPEREERIPAGAWRNMQDLLEKSATTGGAAGSRRYGLYAVFALLTVGMGVSALSLQNRQLRDKDAAPIVAAETGGQLSGPLSQNNTTATELSPSASGNNNIHNTPTGNTTASADAAGNGNNKEQGNNNNIAAHTPGSSHNNTTQQQATTVVAADKHNNKGRHINATRTDVKRSNNAKNKIAATEATIAADIQKKQFTNPITSSSPANVSATADVALAKIDKQQFAPVMAKDSIYEAVVLDNTNKQKFVVEKHNNEWKKEVTTPVKETTRKVTQSQTADNRIVQHMDTIEQRNYVRTQLIALSDKEKLSLVAIASTAPKVDMKLTANTGAGLDLMASNITNGGGFANLVPLENYKVKTLNKDDRRSFVTRFYDMMNTYMNKDKPFYFGGSLGGQLMFSQPLQSGFNLGLGGYYEFKERYTLGLEFRYLRNSYSGSLVENYQNYSQQTVDRSGATPVYSALEQKFTNTYNLQHSTYLELPVSIRYQLSKLSVMGGVYGSYMTGTKYTTNMAEQNGEAHMVSGPKPFVSTTGSILANDFKARYGMGFTIGAAYDFSKHLSLDVRINQNLWNNLKTSSELSTNLYRATGVQVSLMYFIGKKDKVMYMMAQ
ncbi:MAG: hypothetical protein BGO31_19250 [Bacteroidetes bacterium 43-16]|nr:MAG: hypothetical protein BGO31_19250 [Bacteroidetes bacterium 43-16]